MTRLPLADCLQPVAFLDPHGGKADASHRRLSSRAAIVVVTRDSLDRVFVLHAWAQRVSTDALMDEVTRVADAHNVRVFGCEANGLQGLFADAILRDARLRGRRLPLQPVYQPTHQEKDYRIRTTLQPRIGAGRLFLDRTQPGQLELQHEIVTFPLNPLKDMVDCLASACRLLAPVAARRERDVELEAKLAYLRRTGAPPQLIENAMRSARP